MGKGRGGGSQDHRHVHDTLCQTLPIPDHTLVVYFLSQETGSKRHISRESMNSHWRQFHPSTARGRNGCGVLRVPARVASIVQGCSRYGPGPPCTFCAQTSMTSISYQVRECGSAAGRSETTPISCRGETATLPFETPSPWKPPLCLMLRPAVAYLWERGTPRRGESLIGLTPRGSHTLCLTCSESIFV